LTHVAHSAYKLQFRGKAASRRRACGRPLQLLKWFLKKYNNFMKVMKCLDNLSLSVSVKYTPASSLLDLGNWFRWTT